MTSSVTMMTTVFVAIMLSDAVAQVNNHSHPHCIIRPSDGAVVAVPITDEDWARLGVNAHNDIRALHGAPPLSYQESLCNSSQWVAEKNLHLQRLEESNNMTTNPNLEFHCGENLAFYVSTSRLHLTPGEVVRASLQMCMAYSAREDGQNIYVTAHYHPPGNIVGQYMENVSGGNTLLPLTISLVVITTFCSYVSGFQKKF